MSMIGNFLRISSKEVEALRANPARIKKVLYPDDDGGDTVIGDDVHMEIDKAWNGIHFLLTGTAMGGNPPLGFILGGKPIGDIDVGYGPARSFNATEVRAIAEALRPLTADTLASRFDAAALRASSVYPGFDTGWNDADDRDYLLEHYEILREFVLQTAELGAGLIVYLN